MIVDSVFFPLGCTSAYASKVPKKQGLHIRVIGFIVQGPVV